MYSDPQHEVIFADFLHSVKLGVPQQIIVDAAKELQRRDDNSLVSLQGGYQTPKYSEEGTGLRVLDELAGACRSYVMHFARERFDMDVDRSIDWWMNVSAEGAFNFTHCHGRTDICGIYFVTVPEGAGELILQRNDGSSYTGLYSRTVMGEQLTILPEAGRLYLFPGHLWHAVGYSSCVEDRVSLSFNFGVL